MDVRAGSGRELLRRLAQGGDGVEELLRHDGSGRPSRWPWRMPIPSPEEPQLEAWRRTVERAREAGAWRALVERFVQLRFPIRGGIEEDPAYRAAIRRGEAPAPEASPLAPADPEGIEVRLHDSVAGPVPVIVARNRDDFETLVRALAFRNRPAAVPPAQGACLVSGLVDWERVARHRERWERERGPFARGGWPDEMRRLSGRPELYQDRFVIATTGPYSGVAPPAGLGPERWHEVSLAIRLEHECTHYLAVRAFGRLRHDILEELLADWIGLLRATGAYDPGLARRFLGLDDGGAIAPAGRLHVYRGEPPLGEAAFALLAEVARRGIEGLAALTAALGEAAVEHAVQARAVLAASTLPEWSAADPEFPSLVLARLEELEGRMWVSGGGA